MTDKLTTDERVKLAEYCGKVRCSSPHGVPKDCLEREVWIVEHVNSEDVESLWKPDVYANQRDEVEDVLVKERGSVRMATSAKWCWIQLKNPLEPPSHADVYDGPYDTRGEAVCRAALKVIKGQS